MVLKQGNGICCSSRSGQKNTNPGINTTLTNYPAVRFHVCCDVKCVVILLLVHPEWVPQHSVCTVNDSVGQIEGDCVLFVVLFFCSSIKL